MVDANIPETIASIYNTCLDESGWQRAIDIFLKVIGAKGAILVAQDLNLNPFQLRHHSSHYLEEHLDYYMTEMVPYELSAWHILAKAPALQVLDDTQLWPGEADLKSRPDFAWLLETYGVYRRLGARLNDSRGWIDSIGIQFDAEVENIPECAIRLSHVLLPHMAKAVEISRSFIVLKRYYQAIMSALDHVRIGMCIVTPGGHVEIANQEAGRIFGLDDGIRLSTERKLEFRNAELRGRIDSAITKISDTAFGHAGPRHFSAPVQRLSTAYPFILDVSPLRDSSGEISTDYYGALLTLIDPDSPRGFDTARLKEALNLTHAETDICQLLVDGSSVDEIAERRNSKPATVRSQIKTIYLKTGSNRRDQLIKLILSLSPPIDVPGKSGKG